jgi:hypothetical protein
MTCLGHLPKVFGDPAYNDAPCGPAPNVGTYGGSEAPNHNPLCIGSLEHPLDAGLAQRLAASVLHTEGRGFESLSPHHPSKEISLTRGYVALVSPEDYDRVSAHKWTAMPCGNLVYARRTVRGDDGRCHTILLHRSIVDAVAGEKIDHWDRDGLNCRRYNLRSATTQQNNFNRVFSKPPMHGYLGVSSQTPGRFRGSVSIGNKTHYTKTFPTAIQAAHARDELARQLHGEFCVENFPHRRTNSPHLAAPLSTGVSA